MQHVATAYDPIPRDGGTRYGTDCTRLGVGPNHKDRVRSANGRVNRHHDNDACASSSSKSDSATTAPRIRSEKSKRKRGRSNASTAPCRYATDCRGASSEQLCTHTPPPPAPRPLAPHGAATGRVSMTVGVFRHFVRTLPPKATVDLADVPPIVVTDQGRLHASRVMFPHGMTTAERFLARLGIAGPFDDLPAVPVHASSLPPHHAKQGAMPGARLCHPLQERPAKGPLPTIHDLCCETIVDQARHIYATCGPVAAANAVAELATVLASSDTLVDVALYVCGNTLVTRAVALGMLTLGESRSDIDAVYVCAAWAITPRASAGIYERRAGTEHPSHSE
ncbi:hypothetical protein pkur_cds_775 [Pandoravirus kuranda]|uniref:Uncharacterized protein n=1 Tax=Pandoravirus kuranda TaxID=3019033 RepID=A0AA95EJA9_9VIRU|nr:hypothetical protein pkur_cds_775 [Pandoravirus kuranda]